MAEEESRAGRYEVVWNRVKVYIPFLQELISFYKNDSQQNRQQQLQKISTIYDLLTGQRLNYQSLCKCEKVLLKLYETNPLKKKQSDESSGSTKDAASCNQNDVSDTPASPVPEDAPFEPSTFTGPDTPEEPDTPAEPDMPTESDTPAVPDTPDEPDVHSGADFPDFSNRSIESSANPTAPTSKTVVEDEWDDSPCLNTSSTSNEVVSKPPLSLDEIKRLITTDTESSKVRNPSGNNLSKAISNTLKVLSKDYRAPYDEPSHNPYEDSSRNPNFPYPPMNPPPPPPHRSHPPPPTAPWESPNEYGSFPHPVSNSFRHPPVQNSNNIDLTPRSNSPQLYRRRDDISTSDRMDISPVYSSPSEGRSPTIPIPAPHFKDPRLRKAASTAMGMHSPTSEPNMLFPSVKANDPRLNRANVPLGHPTPMHAPAPAPNELPKCVAPNPNLPLDLPKKDPPKRRLSICVNQVIVEEIPPEPVLPPKGFPTRRMSVCGDFPPPTNRFDQPFHGMSFPLGRAPVQPIPPMLPPPPPPVAPMMPPSPGMPPLTPPAHVIPPMMPPSQAIPVITAQHIEAPSVAERDPRRRHLPPGADYIQASHSQHIPGRFDRPISAAPQTYAEYRRQKEMREKQQHQYHQQRNHNNQKKPETIDEKADRNKTGAENKEKQDSLKKSNEDADITLGMVPNKSRVAAKAYAKPPKFAQHKERQFAPSGKEKTHSDSHKSHSKSHKSESSTSHKSHSQKRDEHVKDKAKSAPKPKDLFGEQLSQFDKMYRSGDFSKKGAPSGIGGFKIPKIKKVEKPAEIVPPTPSAEKTSKASNKKDKSMSKSPEPTKQLGDEDALWDDDSACTKKTEKGKAEKKDKSKRQSAPASLNDDDCWDAEPPCVEASPVCTEEAAHAAISPVAQASAVSTEEPKEVAAPQVEKAVEKPDDVFQVPSMPAPRRILRRRNSVAISQQPVKEADKVFASPEPVGMLTRIRKRRNSIAVSQLEDECTNKIEEKLVEDKPIEKQAEDKPVEIPVTVSVSEEDIIRPRRTCRRKPIIDDDDEDNEEGETSKTVSAPAAEEKAASEGVTTDNTTEQGEKITSTVEEHGDNVVSSTTSETTTKKRKRGRKPKATAAVDISTSNDSDHDTSVASAATADDGAEEAEVPVAESASADSSTPKKEEAELKEEVVAPSETKEEKEEKENKALVEGMLQGSTSADSKAQLLEMLSKMLDEKKLKKIQEIIESPSDKSIGTEAEQEADTEGSRERTASTSISSTNEAMEKEKPGAKPKKKSELDKLNEDIAEMYIRDGVLSATGRRSCAKRQDAAPVVVRAKPGPRKSSPMPPVVRAKPGPKKKSPMPLVEVMEPKKGMEIGPNERVRLGNLKVLVIKVDPSKVANVIRWPHQEDTEDETVSIASSGPTTTSPKTKKKKRSTWASGVVPKKKKKVDIPAKKAPPSPVKVYSPKPVTKNVSRELNCKSDKSKDCALCSYVGPHSAIVQHYVRNHPLHEVYVSRIPTAIANKLKKDPTVVTGSIHDQNITFQCIFCQEVLSKKKYNWKLHLASHTGEYRYKCSNCTIKSLAPSTNAHDGECVGPAMDVINDVMFEDNHIFAYMCRLCNFVQLSRPKMEAHLKEEHERQLPGRGILKFSILNFAEENALESKSSETVDSDISMPELTPQVVNREPTCLSAFIPTAPDEIESLKVLNDRNFVSPSKPSIVDKLKQNFDEIMRKDAEKQLAAKPTASNKDADDDEWEDIESPQKDAHPKQQQQQQQQQKVAKAKRTLTISTSSADDIPMPTPLAVKEENVDIFEAKQVVANVGFSKIQNKTWYLCLIGGCKYITLVRSEMYSHADEQHESIAWDGYCYLCTAQVVDDESSQLSKEIRHMAVIHIKDHSAVDELSAPPSSSTSPSLKDDQPPLKLRRFSGDKLSIGTPDQVDEVAISLKPWLEVPTSKSRPHCINMLEQKSLFCFYKCMGTLCCFTTTMDSMMEKHLDNHELVGDITGVTGPSKSWLECAYCEIVADCKVDLMRHLRLVHRSSAHQCAYCFYRSRDAYNVILHQKLHHTSKANQVLLIEDEKKALTPADLDMLNRRRVENILPLICTACKAEYRVLDAFMTHLKDDHADLSTIACQCCKENIPKLKLPRHLLLHNIGIYECIFCQFGSNTLDAVQMHVCNRHPMEPLYCCIRYNKAQGKVKEATLKSLYEMTIDEKSILRCPFKKEELNYKSPDTKSNHDINFSPKAGVIPLQLPPIRIGDTNILLSAQIPSSSSSTSVTATAQPTVVVSAKAAELIKMPMISAVSGGVALAASTSVPIITAVHANYQEPAPVQTQIMPVISAVVGGASMPIITRVEGGVADVTRPTPASSLVGSKIIISPNKGLPIITNVCSIGSSTTNQVQTARNEDEAIMLEAERIAMEMIKDTGLPKTVLYKCIFKGCNAVLPDGTGMRKHLTFTHLPSNQYACVHCKGKPTFPTVMAFTQHLKTHEAHRIFCFICDYKGSFPPEVIKHVKDVHKTNKPTILFLNPKKNDPNNDIILFAPGLPTEVEKKAFYRQLIDLYNHKLQAALIQQKTHFAPEECETLPKQAIFSQMVYCNKCQYSTKVRLNMYRHLKGHLNDQPVSNIDPKNPVPCWGQGEKHFDRMRNPAASSQEDDDLIQSLCFVQESKRYICGAPDCRYITHNEGMLRNHLGTLHCDVKDYKCPHCPAVHAFSAQLNVDKVLEHLKLHDKELYQCSKCGLFLNNKPDMESHINTAHKSANASVMIIRDGSAAGSAATLAGGASDDTLIFKWKCDVCKFKSVTIGEMRAHMQDMHTISSKYRCSRCLFSCSNKFMFSTHFEKQHPGCEIVIISLYKAIQGDDSRADTTPLWRRETSRTRSIRGIEVEDEDEEEEELETNPSELGDAILLDEPQPGSSGINESRKRRSDESISDIGDVTLKRARSDDSSGAVPVKAFKCGFKGCSYADDFGTGIVIHFKKAHPNEKPSVQRNSLANADQSRFDYFLKYACFYCVKKADTIQDLLAHWRQMHKITGLRSQDKPFLFRTAKLVLCFHCRKGAVMPEMKSHVASNHPSMAPIYLDFRNPKRCAECDFTMTTSRQDMITHYATHHSTENEYAKGWIDYLTDDVLDKILQLNCVTYQCEKCEFTSDKQADFTGHYANRHPFNRVEFNEFSVDKKIIYHCAYNNCKTNCSSAQDLALHILTHIPMFKCANSTPSCNAQFRSFTMLLQHFQTTHLHQDLMYALKTPEEYQMLLRLVNIQFWNGFVMSLDDARRAGNRYGNHEGFFKHVDDLCAKSVAESTTALM